ncbi:MAG: 2-oxoacid:acceptor oxidoreductase subunit alpha [Thermoguttaceae bacterium]|jgi:2-oxoglutarate ferredoxin oxidoreductase subunit alpha|nr:2-oxoacid:acceptor oxidoreductase subunit alpha [Thermoguttaceae bacterium]
MIHEQQPCASEPDQSLGREELDEATVRFCGDSGDGMQLAGTQLTNTSALVGNDVATFPDFPAEIRAPRGTQAGVSGFQVHFASRRIFTPGDQVDALVAMNPAALVTNLPDLRPGGIVIVDADSFTPRDLQTAGLKTSPLEDGTLASYQVFQVDITRLTRLAVKDLGLGTKDADRCRNFFAMGLVYWLFDRPVEPTLRFVIEKFGRRPDVAESNRRALLAGYHYGETTEAFAHRYAVDRARLPPGKYTHITGNQAMAWGLLAAARLSGCDLFYGTYPITPASDILHELARRKNFGVRTFQAEDEIAAVTAVIGAAFGGAMGVTGTSGPGLSLKGEGIGLAVMTELPMLVIDVQRAGPSTGMPTKTEQADLNQALFGRHGECPLPVLAAAHPADCFDVAREAWRIAVRYMTPVLVLSDAFIANGSEPWRIPKMSELEPIEVRHPGPLSNGQPFQPYRRDERLARPWALPGTPGLMHRLGGLEKQDITGAVSYDGANHQHMVDLRARKVAGIAADIPPQTVEGPKRGRLLILGWGGTYGPIATAVRRLWERGASVAHAHLRYLNPFPANLGEVLRNYDRVLIPELNRGQLRALVRAEYLVDAIGWNKTTGRPFTVGEIVAGAEPWI